MQSKGLSRVFSMTAQEEAGWPWWRRAPLACRPVWCPAPRRAPDREEVGGYLAHRRRHRASRARLPEDAPSSGPCGPVWGPGEEPRGPQGGSRSLAFVLEAELSPCVDWASTVFPGLGDTLCRLHRCGDLNFCQDKALGLRGCLVWLT